MNEYISKEDALNAMCRRCAINCPLNKCAEYRSLAEDIAAVIPADVNPVARGEWEEYDDWNDSNIYRCSNCGSEFMLEAGTPKENDYNFCPNCGAEMRERSKEE